MYLHTNYWKHLYSPSGLQGNIDSIPQQILFRFYLQTSHPPAASFYLRFVRFRLGTRVANAESNASTTATGVAFAGMIVKRFEQRQDIQGSTRPG